MNSNNALRQTRISVNIPATYFLKGSQGEAHIVDMSVGGIGLEVKQLFVIDDLIRIKFTIPGSDGIDVDFWGIVKNVSGGVLGIKYEEISNDSMEAISQYMGTSLLKMGKAARESF